MITTEVKSVVVRFFDGSKIFITKEQEKALWQMSTTEAKKIKIDGQGYSFSSIDKILSLDEYYDQYPKERPEPPPTYFKVDSSQQIRNPSNKARERMKEGFIRGSVITWGRTKEQAESCFEKFIQKV